eukprot:SAG31_NODE_14197_length_822_cov_0.778700_1_plen_111_part_10
MDSSNAPLAVPRTGPLKVAEASPVKVSALEQESIQLPAAPVSTSDTAAGSGTTTAVLTVVKPPAPSSVNEAGSPSEATSSPAKTVILPTESGSPRALPLSSVQRPLHTTLA